VTRARDPFAFAVVVVGLILLVSVILIAIHAYIT
jgi:hypothetical protein